MVVHLGFSNPPPPFFPPLPPLFFFYFSSSPFFHPHPQIPFFIFSFFHLRNLAKKKRGRKRRRGFIPNENFSREGGEWVVLPTKKKQISPKKGDLNNLIIIHNPNTTDTTTTPNHHNHRNHITKKIINTTINTIIKTFKQPKTTTKSSRHQGIGMRMELGS